MKFTTFACLAALGLGGAAVMATPAAAQSWDYRWGGPPSAGIVIGAPSHGWRGPPSAGVVIGEPSYGWDRRPYYGRDWDAYAYESEPGSGGGSVTIIEEGRGSSAGAIASCMQRFKSYDPRSGTYLGYDGVRHPCP